MDRAEKLKELLKVANGGLSYEEFTKAFDKILKYILAMEIELTKRVDSKTGEEKKKLEQLKEEFSQIVSQAKTESDSTLGGIRRKTNEIINKLFARNDVNKKLQERLNEVSRKLGSIRNGIDGINGVDGIDGQDGKDGIDGVGKDGKDAKIDKSELEKLREELKEVRRMRRVGGGTSALGIANAAKYWVKTEAPSGTIDGTNKAFTVSKTIFAVISFSLNGEFIAQLPNYTISNKTVTFSEAIPAAYSGKDFEIVYV